MTAAHTAVVALLVQQLLFVLMWIGIAVAGLSRSPSLHWAAGAVGLAGGMALALLRDRVDPLVGFWLGNIGFVGGFVALRRGVEAFVARPHAEREHAAALAAVVLLALLERGRMPGWVSVAALSLLMSAVLARAAWAAQAGLRDELGPRAALLCAAPLWITATVLALRAGLGPLAPSMVAPTLSAPMPINLAMLIAFIACGIALALGQLALVLTRLVQQLRHLSEHDALTGVLNRRAIEQALALQAAQQARHGRSYAVLALDIDHFKAINDRHGHPAGDAVLCALAGLMQQAGRTGDRVARTGGEEFWMLLPDTGLAGALQVAERLQALVRTRTVAAGAAEIRFTVSIGVAVAQSSGESSDALLRRLDAALYDAKRQGRDRVAPARPLSPQPA